MLTATLRIMKQICLMFYFVHFVYLTRAAFQLTESFTYVDYQTHIP
jgi:hypothetical protein